MLRFGCHRISVCTHYWAEKGWGEKAIERTAATARASTCGCCPVTWIVWFSCTHTNTHTRTRNNSSRQSVYILLTVCDCAVNIQKTHTQTHTLKSNGSGTMYADLKEAEKRQSILAHVLVYMYELEVEHTKTHLHPIHVHTSVCKYVCIWKNVYK